MRTLILASGSKARQRLLKDLGLQFKIFKSNVKESRSSKKPCAELVIDNALKKAVDAAKHYKSGIVISADTVVLAGKKIIGKPRSLKDAVNSLRILSKKPQWVYTGIAVIDIDQDKALTDYEKTKVYMCPLSEEEIRHYFKKISPFEKAGSFDVQGIGSIFIDRIEGCFYNVVGLPLARLAKLLKKIGVDIFNI